MKGFISTLLALGLTLSTSASVSASESGDAIPVCYDFGCKTLVKVNIAEDELSQAAGWLATPARTPEEERENLAKAIGWMEAVSYTHLTLPTIYSV